MKKIGSQVTVAIVCCILGFVLTYQFRQINKKEANAAISGNTTDITQQVQQLTKQKETMQSKIDELEGKLKNYEKDASNTSNSNKQLLDDLTKSRIVNGVLEVKGSGIVITFTPISNLFETGDAEVMTPSMLSVLINNINALEAEAISINDIRITGRTGIVQSGSLIKIDDEAISPYKKVTIKVIGDKKKIESVLEISHAYSDFTKRYTVEVSKSDDISITKFKGNFKFNYAKPVENK